MDPLCLSKISVFYFSVLSNWILHVVRALRLLPLRLAGRESAYLLLLPRPSSRLRARRIAHYVVAVQSCSLSDHRRETTCVREHFLLI